MDTRLEALAGFVLDGLICRNLSDATAYEFAEQVCICIQEDPVVSWGNQLNRLWDYLKRGSSAIDSAEQDISIVFQQGRIYAAMELMKMYCQHQEDENILEEDAREYSDHWSMVFLALNNGKSMTHRELARAAGLSDSSLSQFLHKIEKKNYILSRKAGRTKYYWLSSRGKELVKCMPSRKQFGFHIGRKSEIEKLEAFYETYLLLSNNSYMQNKMYLKESYPLAYLERIKPTLEAKEEMYVGVREYAG